LYGFEFAYNERSFEGWYLSKLMGFKGEIKPIKGVKIILNS
jgi:hypothetical protein